MKKYLFRTTATMKDYNRRQYWIDAETVPEIEINAEGLPEAVEKYREAVGRQYIEISKTAAKKPEKMYQDGADGAPVWIGYIFTGKMEMPNDAEEMRFQYIELWAKIDILTPCGLAC